MKETISILSTSSGYETTQGVVELLEALESLTNEVSDKLPDSKEDIQLHRGLIVEIFPSLGENFAKIMKFFAEFYYCDFEKSWLLKSSEDSCEEKNQVEGQQLAPRLAARDESNISEENIEVEDLSLKINERR